MSYNTELQSNNADLQEILDAVNALPDAGAELPELTNPGTAEDLEDGKELIDAEGNIVTGTVRVAHGGITQEADSINRIPMGDQSRIKLTVNVEEKTIIKPSTGNVISLTAPCSEFGDAAAEDVAKGKTFTSAAGLKAVGTKEESGGIETVQVTVSVINWNGSIWYTDASYSFQSLSTLGSAIYEIACLKNSPVIFSGYGFTPSIEADYEISYEEDMGANGMYIYHFTEDCTIMVEGAGGGIEAPED